VGAAETVWRSTPSTGSATTSLVDASGGRLSVTLGATTAWTLFDELGSMAALVSSGASLSAAYRFDAFGNALTTLSRASNPYGFTGSINLGTDAVPLYEMGARLYAPSVGAFSQMDSSAGTATDPASLNRFLYAQANPATLVDPSGHTACSAYADYCPVNGSTTKHTVQKQDASGHRAGHRGRRTEGDVYGDQRNRARSYARYGEGGQYADAAYRASPKIQKIAQAAAQDDARESAAHDAAARTYSPPAASDDGGGGFFGISINVDIHVDSGLVHAGLDVVGMLPVVGTAADLANAGIYAAEGDYGLAALSAVSAIPVVGDVLGAGKIALKYGDDAIEAGEFALKHGDEIAEGLGAAAKYGDNLVEGAGDAAKQVLKNKENGDAFADGIASLYQGSRREVTMEAESGLRRADVLTAERGSIEAKLGRTGVTRRTRQEVQRDVELRRDGKVSSLEWVFGTSPVTGKVGPTRPLADLLDANDIPWRIVP
jgi:RHS repeat-associated protein